MFIKDRWNLFVRKLFWSRIHLWKWDWLDYHQLCIKMKGWGYRVPHEIMVLSKVATCREVSRLVEGYNCRMKNISINSLFECISDDNPLTQRVACKTAFSFWRSFVCQDQLEICDSSRCEACDRTDRRSKRAKKAQGRGIKTFPNLPKAISKKSQPSQFLVYFSLHLFYKKERKQWPKTMMVLVGLDARKKDSFIMFNSLELFLFVWETETTVSLYFGHYSFNISQ